MGTLLEAPKLPVALLPSARLPAAHSIRLQHIWHRDATLEQQHVARNRINESLLSF